MGDYKPSDISTTETGKLIVVCSNSHQVLVFTTSGTKVDCFGIKGRGPERLADLRHVAVSSAHGGIASCDYSNRSVTIICVD